MVKLSKGEFVNVAAKKSKSKIYHSNKLNSEAFTYTSGSLLLLPANLMT